MKTGILGGTFDPVHNGHIALAQAAKELCSLDDVILVPAAVPPHKQGVSVTAFNHRMAMVELAIQDIPEISVSSVEQILPYPSFTIDTLRYLKLNSPDPVELYFITGADAFLDILSWKEYRAILAISNIIVFSRVGIKNSELNDFIGDTGYQKMEKGWFHSKYKTWLYSSSSPLPDVSSSRIRSHYQKNLPVNKLISQHVSRYIMENDLY